ncbi:MAG: TetR/AcrR family transcriptional regulator [Clostridiales bacterium]|nr:TetR/AcrR family transcriptional regulator [Clostridiales bacterium]
MSRPASARERMIQTMTDLLQRNGAERVSVTQIIAGAEVNRSTFYRNFTDIFALRDEVCRVEARRLFADLPSPDPGDPDFNINRFADDAAFLILENWDRVDCLFRGDDPWRLLEVFTDEYRAFLEPTVASYTAPDSRTDLFLDLQKDYLTVLIICEKLNGAGSYTHLMKTGDTEYTYDYSADFVGNVTRLVSLLTGTPEEFNRKVIRALMGRLEHGKQFGDITVTGLLQKAGVTRTEFYRHYANLKAMEDALTEAACIIEIRHIYALCLLPWDEIPERLAKYREMTGSLSLFLLRNEDVYDMRIRLIGHVGKKLRETYSAHVIETRGKDFYDEKKNMMAHFVCGMLALVNHYVIFADSSLMNTQLGVLLEVKKKHGF